MRHQVCLGLLAMALFFLNLGAAGLGCRRSDFFAVGSRDDDAGRLGGRISMAKFFRQAAADVLGNDRGLQGFRPNEFAARFWSAVFGVGSVLLTYRLGRALFSPMVGLWAGLVLATSLNFNLIARGCPHPNSMLAFFSMLAVLVLVWGTRGKASTLTGDVADGQSPWRSNARSDKTAVTGPVALVRRSVVGCGTPWPTQ